MFHFDYSLPFHFFFSYLRLSLSSPLFYPFFFYSPFPLLFATGPRKPFRQQSTRSWHSILSLPILFSPLSFLNSLLRSSKPPQISPFTFHQLTLIQSQQYGVIQLLLISSLPVLMMGPSRFGISDQANKLYSPLVLKTLKPMGKSQTERRWRRMGKSRELEGKFWRWIGLKMVRLSFVVVKIRNSRFGEERESGRRWCSLG